MFTKPILVVLYLRLTVKLRKNIIIFDPSGNGPCKSAGGIDTLITIYVWFSSSRTNKMPRTIDYTPGRKVAFQDKKMAQLRGGAFILVQGFWTVGRVPRSPPVIELSQNEYRAKFCVVSGQPTHDSEVVVIVQPQF